MAFTDARGLAATGADHAALDRFETALAQFQCYTGDPVATLDGITADRPGFAMAHLMRGWLLGLAMEAKLLPEARRSLGAAAVLPMNERERAHAAALGDLLDGRFADAFRALDGILADHPRDALALQVGHLGDYYLGDARNLRDRVARVLPCWTDADPGFHAVLGMHAFGLEEMAAYGAAEETGRRAVALNPRDGWAQHAVAHVLEMQGRTGDGIAWMRGNQEHWSTDSFFAVHNWWHLALYHWDQRQLDAVFDLYDRHVRATPSEVVLDMIDASALLWRLHLEGVEVGDRWQELADGWEPLARDAHYAFNDLHAMMAFVAAGRHDSAAALIDAQAARIARGGDNAEMTARVGLPLCRAIQAFGRGDYAGTVALMAPVRGIANRFGGSHAQRDVIDLTLMEAALRDGRKGMAVALSAERLALKPDSPLNRLFRARAKAEPVLA